MKKESSTYKKKKMEIISNWFSFQMSLTLYIFQQIWSKYKLAFKEIMNKNFNSYSCLKYYDNASKKFCD